MSSIRNCMQSRYQPDSETDLAKCLSKMCNRSSPITDLQRILQDFDLARLRAIIYRERFDDSNQSEFLALSAVYFLSVLLVSKYRDLLDPELEAKIMDQVDAWKFIENEKDGKSEKKFSDNTGKGKGSVSEVLVSDKDKVQSILKSLVNNSKSESSKGKNFGKSIMSTIDDTNSVDEQPPRYNEPEDNKRTVNELPDQPSQLTRTSSKIKPISQQLNSSMAGSVGLLSDIMVDFQEYRVVLQKCHKGFEIG